MYLFKDKQGNMLDWIISKENSITISRIQEGDYLSDHCTITWNLKVEKTPMEKINHTIRNLKSINEPNFASDLAERLSQLNNINNLQTLYEGYINNINTRSTCSRDHKERNEETAKIMV